MTLSSSTKLINWISSLNLVRTIGILSTLLLPIILLPMPCTCSQAPAKPVVLSHAKFKKIPQKGTHYKGLIRAPFPNHMEACAAGCLTWRLKHHACEAFAYSPGVCRYLGYQGNPIGDSVLQLLELQDRDTFLTVHVGDQVYSYLLSTETMNFFAARKYCHARGGYLLEIDSLDEYDALKMVGGTDGKNFFLGINDFEEEGKYVTDRENKTVDPNLLRWRGNEPHPGFKETDDILSFRSHDYTINDVPLKSIYHAACERDP